MGQSDDANTTRKPRYTPAQHRARSHDSAHAAEDEPALAELPKHPLLPRDAAKLVTDDAGLARLIDRLRASGSFVYDSEFIGELTYHPKLCLIQTATAEGVWLIDPLAKVDLTPFWELLCDASVEKIVHAGQQDLEPVIRLLGRRPTNIFDTQIAAGFAALPYPLSLSKLVAALCGVQLGKGLTFTDWAQRPLSSKQLRYAADDVRFLTLARRELGVRLEALGHVEWVREECESLSDPALHEFDPESDYLRVRGAGSLQPKQLAVLRELTRWRDAAAQESDVPPRTFLKDEILIDLSRTPIQSIDRLARVKGLPRPVESAHGGEIIERTRRAMATPPEELPAARETEPPPAMRFEAEAFWAAAQCICAGQSLDPAVVASRQEIGALHRLLSSGSDTTESKTMTGWRREALGRRLVELFEGKSRLELQWKDGLRVANRLD